MPIKDASQEQGTNRKHPVPQNVMDVEFKVVGDLTVRQIVYIAIGFSIAYIFYRSGLPVVWQYGLAIFMVLLTLAVAFVPYEDRGLDKWLVIFIRSMFGPTQMIWQKSYSSPAYFLSDYAQIIRNEIITLTPVKNRTKLEEYLELIEDKGDELEIERSSKLSQITDLMGNSSSKIGIPTPLKTLSASSFERSNIELTRETPSLVSQTVITEKSSNQNENVSEETPKIKIVTTSPIADIKHEEIVKDEIQSKEEIIEAIYPKETQAETKIDRPISMTAEIDQKLGNNADIKIPNFRKLPTIIVEEDIKDIKEKEESLEKKVNELVELAKRARSKYQIETGNKLPVKDEKIEMAKTRFGELEKEKEKLLRELEKSTEQVKHMENTTKKKEHLEEQVEKLTTQNAYLEKILSDLKDELYDLKHSKTDSDGMKMDDILNANKDHLQKPQQDGNIISGVVKDSKGTFIQDAVILIKDDNGNVVRALKTNMLGQFASQSSMENGKYKVEVVKGGLNFDIMVVEAKGLPLNPLYFVSKN